MGKMITLSILSIGIVSMAGCTQQGPATNQSTNQPTADINQNVNQPVVNQNQPTIPPPVAQQPAQPTDKTSLWQIYRSDYGFQIQYPQDWKIVNEINAKDLNRPTAVLLNVSFGNGTYGNGYDGELFISVYDKRTADTETPIKDIGKQFSDRQEKRETITINGISAVKITITTPSIPSWIYEAVKIEQGNYSYLLSNGAIKTDLFDSFYGSFKLN